MNTLASQQRNRVVEEAMELQRMAARIRQQARRVCWLAEDWRDPNEAKSVKPARYHKASPPAA